jgi:biofilm protein TabA
MFLGRLSTPLPWELFLRESRVEQSLDWIAEHAATSPEGIYELGEPGWYVNVHGYATQARELCAWENHLETIDLQYLIEGSEGIDLAPVATLGAATSFKPESDTQKFANLAVDFTQLHLHAGDFAIFFPGEAHRQKISR